MVMDVVPGKTQDKGKPFCMYSQMAALERGSPLAATVIRAGLALPARSPDLRVDLRKQHKARNMPLSLLCLSCRFPGPIETLPLPLISLQSTFPNTLLVGSLKGEKRELREEGVWDVKGPLRSANSSKIASLGLFLL